MEFPYAADSCYLAHCYPYTYTDLKDDLDSLLTDPYRSQFVKKEIMCETKAGNSCYLLTVTDFSCRTRKKHVVVSSRVHPGESNASWMVKGLVDFITGDSKEAVGEGIFNFEGCKFHIRKCKESTGRVVMFRHFNIKNSFTMEATFCGTVKDM
ncbi:hypothetical protein EB796_017508 [Bugula neritina]|uniref:Peptidase M14 carboxypeptidase A domain-containing protein n=1 Tax=Bugula neritina TaxID=10212 RepID=A0A7J7JDS8_BUGNE|nr:hypothetical protein EB796_017508 [Bugula neritina]